MTDAIRSDQLRPSPSFTGRGLVVSSSLLRPSSTFEGRFLLMFTEI
jgi:hypothetical protein